MVRLVIKLLETVFVVWQLTENDIEYQYQYIFLGIHVAISDARVRERDQWSQKLFNILVIIVFRFFSEKQERNFSFVSQSSLILFGTCGNLFSLTPLSVTAIVINEKFCFTIFPLSDYIECDSNNLLMIYPVPNSFSLCIFNGVLNIIKFCIRFATGKY